MCDEDIINIFFVGKTKRFSRKYEDLLTDEIKYYLDNRFIDKSNSYKESIYRIKNNIEVLPICPTCGNKIHMDNHNHYRDHCSLKCSFNDEIVINKITNTKIDRYNNPKYVNLDKRYKTNIEKYGCKYVFSNEDIKHKVYNTKLKKYGNGYFCNQKKSEETCFKKYGVKTPLNLQEVHEKSKQTCLEKYGCEKPLQNVEIFNKFKNTCLQRYGIEYPQKLDYIKNKIDYDEVVKKVVATKRKNHTFKDSKKEKESYTILKKVFKDDLDYQYRSELYPYYCDFYIHSLNLYIECNYHWTHGGFPYIETEQRCIDKLNKWKSKNSRYYNNAITTWTIRDVNKRNIAKNNNLNWIEFWNIDELKKWIINYDN